MSECPREVEFAKELQAVSDRSARNEGRIKKLEEKSDALQSLATSVAVMAEQMKVMNAKVGTLTDKVEEIEQRPAKRWETVVACIITGIVGALIGLAMTNIGL